MNCGCLYVVAWGHECEAWHDAVDWTLLEKFKFAVPADKFIMTTWHADEPLSEAFWFAGLMAWHPDVELQETVILHISEEARGAELLDAYTRSQDDPPRD